MKRIVNFDLAAHVELQKILSESESFYEVYESVRESDGILGRMADDNRGNSSFWADIADLYDERAMFSTYLIYVIDIKIRGIDAYLNIDKKTLVTEFVHNIDDAIKLSIDGINEINPKLTKFAIPIAQKENKNVYSED